MRLVRRSVAFFEVVDAQMRRQMDVSAHASIVPAPSRKPYYFVRAPSSYTAGKLRKIGVRMPHEQGGYTVRASAVVLRRPMVVCAVILLGILGAGCAADASTSGAAGATTTPKPSSGPAVLGGSGQAFIDRYGPLTSQSDASAGDLHFRQYPDVALDFLIVDLGKRLADTPGDNNAASIVVAARPDH